MRILVAVDGTQHSDLAVALTATLAQVVSVPVAVTLLTVSKQQKATAARLSILDRAAEQLGTAVADIEKRVVLHHTRHPAEAILEAAVGHDLVVMGKRPSTDWRALLMGPTTRQVVGHTLCPVLIAKERPAVSGGQAAPLRHMLLCDSGLQDPPLLNRFLKRMGYLINEDTDVTVLHVMSQISAAPGVAGSQLRADADELMESDAWEGAFLRQDEELLAQKGITRRIKVRHGLVLDEIIEELRDEQYDLLVIGGHRTEGLPNFLLEDISRQLVAKVQRPILVIP